jgi:RNA polymerase sigma-70 factor (ECF subfamily)
VIPLERNQIPENEATEEEPDLIERALTDPTAFAELYRRHLGRIYAYLRTRVACEEDAADLTQQVFLQAFDALPRYRQRGLPFSAWLFQIAHNIVINSYRHQQQVIPWDAIPVHAQPFLVQNPEAGVLQQERIAQLRQLLARLDPAKCELLALRFAAGLSAPQIALVVGRSPAAVKKELTRTLHKLKELYHDQ